MSEAKVIVAKLWNYCHILRDDGLSYGDCLEQLTYLLFLKMAEEQRQLGLPRIVPEGYPSPSLLGLKGEALEAHYIAILNHLGRGDDMMGVIFRQGPDLHPGPGQARAPTTRPHRQRARQHRPPVRHEPGSARHREPGLRQRPRRVHRAGRVDPGRRRGRRRRRVAGRSLFAYVGHVTDWEPWQLAYRYGALYVFPPPRVIEAVDDLRAEYDPVSASTCQAHISLTEPLPGPVGDEGLAELAAACLGIAACEMSYGPLRTFLPHPGVVYDVQPKDRLRELRDALHATSPFSDVVPRRGAVAFHMTIAEFISADRTVELFHELAGRVPEGTFRCEAVEYAVPDAQFRFRRVATLHLAPGSG